MSSPSDPPPTQKLLLIFRKDPDSSFSLVNDPGLPVSNASPVVHAGGKNLVVVPLLLAAITEATRSNVQSYGGFNFLMSWAANDGRHYYVILEKLPPTPKPDNNNNDSSDWNNNSSSLPPPNTDDPTPACDWDNNNNQSDNNQSNPLDEWNPAPPPTTDPTSPDNMPSSRPRANSNASGYDVRHWARSPSDAGGGGGGRSSPVNNRAPSAAGSGLGSGFSLPASLVDEGW
ncbi:hypothetical protein ASPWEDRAFT_168774 [Aspergillus wentii DTO 134E9]|uniref:Uncharacterized protein n=1 Tax=Aspergillus wentii DTO 134E9 TaxID=1073089 RepID=A0A1L9RVC9_ASPWE|nr:uncharacterized protein ASPWEDRAFT_168774 [Aspergillus wentii DTO 134E9]KAI9928801.1 hypothetical protein MW887_002022 [Aspergillus wentii]OJJ38901.1 hypothetical protein ASPWEDRAFT_168774 [Aspergillus wentii DTO 134E9]